MTWDPIVDGELAGRTRAVVAELVDALATVAAPSHELALFWTYAAAALESDPPLAARIAAAAAPAMARFADDLQHAPPRVLALHGGLAGYAWVAAHVADGIEPWLAAVDATLTTALAGWTGDYDLISGLVGFAVYALERGDAATLARIVDLLATRATHLPDGIAWFTSADLVAGVHRRTYPHGYYNCGLAHGVPGVVAVLARIAAHPAATSATRATAGELRDEATRWLLAQRLPGREFPAAAGGPPSRTAWCYGDPGVAVALWDAAAPADRDALALGWIGRDAVGIADAAICHGSAGLAHLANRMFHATRDDRYRAAARGWIAHTLDLHRPGSGVGGFMMVRAGAPVATASLVDGAIGTALVLLAASTEVESVWDRMFLCDLPVVDLASR